MVPRTYSLKEIAPMLARIHTGTGEAVLMRQVRHWTNNELLKPIKKDTGRGRDRQYAAHEIRKAVVLAELAHFGMTIPLLDSVADWLDMLEEDQVAAWQFAKDAHWRIFGCFAWAQDESFQAALRAHDDDVADMHKDSRSKRFTILPVSTLFNQRKMQFMDHLYSQVVVNLTDLFSRIEWRAT